MTAQQQETESSSNSSALHIATIQTTSFSSTSTVFKKEQKTSSPVHELYGLFPTAAEIKADQTRLISDHLPLVFQELPFSNLCPMTFNLMNLQLNTAYGQAVSLAKESIEDRAKRVANTILACVKQSAQTKPINFIALQETDVPKQAGVPCFNDAWLKMLQEELNRTGQTWNFISHADARVASFYNDTLGSYLSHIAKPGRVTTTFRQKDCKETLEITNVYLTHQDIPKTQKKLILALLTAPNSIVIGDFNSRIRKSAKPEAGLMINGLVSERFTERLDDIPQEIGCDSSDGLFFRYQGGRFQQAERTQLRLEDGTPIPPITIKDITQLSARQQHELTRPQMFLDVDERITQLTLLEIAPEKFLTCDEYEELLQSQRKQLKNEKFEHGFSVCIGENLLGEKIDEQQRPALIAVSLPQNFQKDLLTAFASNSFLSSIKSRTFESGETVCYVRIADFPKFHATVMKTLSSQAAVSSKTQTDNREALLKAAESEDFDSTWKGYDEDTGFLYLLSKLVVSNNKLKTELKSIKSCQTIKDISTEFCVIRRPVNQISQILSKLTETQYKLTVDEANELAAELKQFAQNVTFLCADMALLLKRVPDLAGPLNKQSVSKEIEELQFMVKELYAPLSKPLADSKKESKTSNVDVEANVANVRALALISNQIGKAKFVQPIWRIDFDGIAIPVRNSLSFFNLETRAFLLFKAMHQFDELPANFKKEDLIPAMKELLKSAPYLNWFAENFEIHLINPAKNTEAVKAFRVRYSVAKFFKEFTWEILKEAQSKELREYLKDLCNEFDRNYTHRGNNQSASSITTPSSGPR
jgi:hypothetical protein